VDALLLQGVQPNVFGLSHYKKILRCIVLTVSIEMVNDFIALQRPPDLLLGHNPVLMAAMHLWICVWQKATIIRSATSSAFLTSLRDAFLRHMSLLTNE